MPARPVAVTTITTHRNPRIDTRYCREHGFSLIDLLLALTLGVGLSSMILQLLVSESTLGVRVNRVLRERSVQQRTIALIRDEVQRSSRISATPQLEQHSCNIGGRLPVLHLSTTAGAITYSVGDAPSAIWRGKVLMRCGPAFDLQGQPTSGVVSQNRVVLDALATNPEEWKGCSKLIQTVSTEPVKLQDVNESSKAPMSACIEQTKLRIGVRLAQEFHLQGLKHQQIISEAVFTNST